MVDTTAEEEVVATGAEAMVTLVATPLGGNSVQRNAYVFGPFSFLGHKKVTFHRLFLLASKRKGAKEGLKHGAIFGVLWAFCFF